MKLLRLRPNSIEQALAAMLVLFLGIACASRQQPIPPDFTGLYAYTIQWPRGNAEGILDLECSSERCDGSVSSMWGPLQIRRSSFRDGGLWIHATHPMSDVTMHLFRSNGALRGTCTVNRSRCTVEAEPTAEPRP